MKTITGFIENYPETISGRIRAKWDITAHLSLYYLKA